MAVIESCPGCEATHGTSDLLKDDPDRSSKHVRLVPFVDDDLDEAAMVPNRQPD